MALARLDLEQLTVRPAASTHGWQMHGRRRRYTTAGSALSNSSNASHRPRSASAELFAVLRQRLEVQMPALVDEVRRVFHRRRPGTLPPAALPRPTPPSAPVAAATSFCLELSRPPCRRRQRYYKQAYPCPQATLAADRQVSSFLINAATTALSAPSRRR